MDWVLSALTIFMNIILGKKSEWGWVLLIGISLLWIYYAITIKQYGLIPAAFVNVLVGAYNTNKWYQERKHETSSSRQ